MRTRIFGAGIATVLLLPWIALAAPKNFAEFAAVVVNLIDVATGVLMVFGLVVYFWGMAVNIPHFGDEKGSEKRKGFFLWGLIVLFVMFSIWGIIQILQASLFKGQYSPTYGPGVGSGGAFDTFDGKWEAP